jgi:TolB-like protein/tetratricopeptide (TPR) repeat protein/DNA-binding winged helix-turn-helix (wHTH) protein
VSLQGEAIQSVNTALMQGFKLGIWQVVPATGQLIGPSGETHLPSRAMEVLLCLASTPGDLVTREALLGQVWGAGQGSQEALNHAVSEIRHALGDHADNPVYIQTLPRRGYRLICPVEMPGSEPSEPLVSPASVDTSVLDQTGWFENVKRRGVLETGIAYVIVGWLILQVADVIFDQLHVPEWVGTFVTLQVIAGFPIALLLSWYFDFRDGRTVAVGDTPAIKRKQFSRTYLSMIGAFGIAALVVFLIDLGPGIPEAEAESGTAKVAAQAPLPDIHENSIAVLRFDNLDGSDRTYAFAAGLADDVIDGLAHVPGLLVSARGDSFSLQPNTSSLRVRERLRVAYYLEGSVQMSGDTMRVIVQMIETESGFHVMSRTFDRPVEDFFDIRDEITELTVANVRIALPRELQYATYNAADINAYVLYRKGKDLFDRGPVKDVLDDVIDNYEKALLLDPEYAAAYAGICEAHTAHYSYSNDKADISAAEDACGKALGANPRLGLVHNALGDLYRRTGSDDEAARAFNSALQLDSRDAKAMTGLSRVRARQLNLGEAENLLRQAIDLQPGSFQTRSRLGEFLFSQGRYDEAADVFRQLVQLEPKSYLARTYLGGALTMAGDFESGKVVYEESLELGESATAYSNLGVLYYYLSDYHRSVQVHRKAIELNPSQVAKWVNLADSLYFDGDLKASKSAFKRATELAESRMEVDARDSQTLFMLAWARFSLGDESTARATLSRALELAPDDPFGLYTKALIETRSGNVESAVAALSDAISKGYPSNLLVAEPYLQDLAGIREFERILR